MGRPILGILAGLVVAWLAMTICEFASLFLHRPSAGLDLRDPQALAELMRTKFAKIQGIQSTKTTVVLETVKEDNHLPIPKPTL